MSLDVHRGILADVKTALAAITPQATPVVSPIPPERLYYNRRDTNAALPHAWLRSENVASGRPALGVEYDAFLQFDAWARNREEAEAIRKAMLKFGSWVVPSHGTAHRIVYSLNTQNVITEETALHLSMVFGANYLEGAGVA